MKLIGGYDTYKEVNSFFINELPQNWQYIKLKYIANIFNGNSLNDAYKQLFESENEDEIAYIASKDINVDNSEINYHNGTRIPKGSENFKIAPKHSALLCIEGGSAGRKIGFINQDVYFVNKLACFNAEDEVTSKFIFYNLQSNHFQSQFFNSITGLIGGVSITNIRNFNIPLPSFQEMFSIINFLDNQTNLIDDIISYKVKQIELLKEKNQAIISEAVTKGFNLDEKLKDSGIDWLGNIPEDWKVIKSKYLTHIITDGAHISPDTASEDFPFVSTVDLIRGEIDWVNCLKTTTENYEYLVRTGCKPIRNDILYSKDGTIGKTTVIQENKDFVVASSLIIVRPKTDLINPFYFEYLLRSNVITYQIDRLLSGVALRRISLEKFSNLLLIVPPLDIQEQILESLQSSNDTFLKTLDSLKVQIDKLKEYRQSIISEAVTGKIDVREWQPNSNLN